MENKLINKDTDPTGILNKVRFKLFRLWVNGIKQSQMPGKMCKSLGWVKKEMGFIFELLDNSITQRDNDNKRKLINKAWQTGMLTKENSYLPEE
jgi:hypothetical protein